MTNNSHEKEKKDSMELVMIILGVMAAAFVKGMCGFANTLVFNAVAGFGASNATITPIDLMMNLPMNTIMICRFRKKIIWKKALFLAGLLILGAVPGAIFLKNADEHLLKVVFGVVVVAMGIDMLRKKESHQRKPHILEGIILGLVAGVMCGLFGVGALMAVYVSKTTKDTEAFKGTVAVVFLVDGLFRLVLYITMGLYTLGVIKMIGLVFPIAMLFLYKGIRCAQKVNESVVKRWITILLIASGVSLIVTNLDGLF